jgi:ABC-type amino acid transport substrate-binding protein
MVRTSRIATLAVTLGLVASFGQGQTVSEIAKVKERGKLVMICFPHQDNPFISVNLAQGPMKKLGTAEDFTGLDVELMTGFAKSLGVTLAIRPVSKPGYDELIPDLLAGLGDLVASSLTITPARQEVAALTDPYFTAPTVVVARHDGVVKSAADIAGKKVAAVRGSAQVDLLLKLGVKPEDLVYVEFSRDSYIAVSEKRADLTLLDGTSVHRVVKEFTDLGIVGTVGPGVSYGIAVRKGSDLLPALNTYLAAQRKNGALDELIRKWTALWKQ